MTPPPHPEAVRPDHAADLAPHLQAVDAVIRERLHSEVALVQQIGHYITSAGGKRVRPRLLLMVAGALGDLGPRAHLLAATVEFIHTATLLHDDVVDESDLRRGRQTANAVFGNAASVLVGDFLYSRAFQMMVSVDDMRVLQVMADATNVIAEGEVLQLMNMHDPDVTVEAYLRVIRYKTAKLFEASAQLGGLAARVADPALLAHCGAIGRHLGTAFQLMDDLLDYEGDTQTLGKNVGDDLREGKPTLPLLLAMSRGTPEQAALIREAIQNGSLEQLDAVLAAVRQTGALEATREAAQRESDAAAQAVMHLPEGDWRKALLDLCAWSTARQH